MYTILVYINAPPNGLLQKGAFVKIEFATLNLQNICENDKLMKKKFGNACANKLKARLADLQSATYVTELAAGRPHPLKYKRLGEFSITISGPLRLIFGCGNKQIPRTDGDAVDWNQVTIIRILSIEDYHE